MPEGHTIHRLARRQAADLKGEVVRARSPQFELGTTVKAAQPAGRAAETIDGRRLVRIDAYGKHLLHRYEGDVTLHVHLGLFGRFVRKRDPAATPPRDTCRLRLAAGPVVCDLSRNVTSTAGAVDCDLSRNVTSTGAVAWDLSGAVASKLLEPPEEDDLLARLGPDPLRADADPERFAAALARRRIPIAAALMDQSVLAGVGNVYRAEALFAIGLDPHVPARAVPAATVDALWTTLTAQLRAGEKAGKIVTVPASESDVPVSKLRGRDRHQVYRRETCRRCGTAVASESMTGRTLWWCPACQAASA